MKSVVFLLTLLMGLGALAGELNISLTPKAYALPISLDRCSGFGKDELKAPAFEFLNLILQWKGAKDLNLSSIQLDLTSEALEQGHYQCVIEGMELNSLFYPLQSHFPGGDSSMYKAFCGLRCGSLPVKASVSEAQIHGKVTVFGYTKDASGNQMGVTATQDVSVDYLESLSTFENIHN